MAPKVSVRSATLGDLEFLLQLEKLAFQTDRFNRSQFQYLITRGKASVSVLEYDGVPAGAAIMLWRKRLTIGRIYNIVVDPSFHGHGLGTILLDECEKQATERGCLELSLEVRLDNAPAIGFYEKHGFHTTERMADYYSDGSTGLKMVKRLTPPRPEKLRVKIPYYAQTQEFTCGSACLMMAFKYHRPEITLNQSLELTLWKEATLVYMTSGIGGTGPFGLALASQRRGFRTRMILSRDQTPFFASVRSESKRKAMAVVHRDLKAKSLKAGVDVDYYDFTFDEIADELYAGRVPIVLIGTYQLHGDHSPHWVAVTGYDSRHVYFHDPYEKFYADKKHLARNIKIPIRQFVQMRQYGRDLYKSVIFVGPQEITPRIAIDGQDL